jgi:transposase
MHVTEDKMTESVTRAVSLDVHKHYVTVGAVDGEQAVVLAPCRVSLETLGQWAAKHLKATDVVAMEATTNATWIHDLLEPLVADIVIANPSHVKLIADSSVKTDAHDTLVLAKMLAAKWLPTIWLPPSHVRELRTLTRHRQQLVKQRTAAKNRLRSLLHTHNLSPPDGGPFAAKNRPWWESLPFSPTNHMLARHDLDLIDNLCTKIEETEAEMARLSVSEPWADQVPFLIQLPGIGLITAMTIMGAIGDITCFPSAKKLVGYSGLGARVHASGQTRYTGRITKAGRRELRTAMVEAAWTAVDHHPHWQAQFQTLAARIGKQKAVVAIARKLLVVVWHVLSRRVPDRHADLPAVKRKFLTWASEYRLATSLGLSRAQFVQQNLEKVGLSA